MKCELKYIEHDVYKIIKSQTLSEHIFIIIIAIASFRVILYFLGDLYWIVGWISATLLIILEWKKAIRHCSNKEQ